MSVSVSDFLKTYEKRFGSGARLASEVPDVEALPTGFPVLDDYVLGVGGFPRGRIVELFGAVSGGKSSLAQVLVGQTQKNGGIVVWLDAEGAWDNEWAKKMGVDVDKLVLPDFDFAEDAFAKALHCVSSGVDLVVIDSLAALQPKVWMEESDGGDGKERRIGMSAKVVGQCCRDAVAGSKNRAPLKHTPLCIVLVNQIR